MTEAKNNIIERLNEAEGMQRKRRKMLRDNLDKCARLEKEYKEALRHETDPEKYNDLILKAEENKNNYVAYQRQYEQKELPALSRQDFELLRRDIQKQAEAIQAEYAPAITALLSELIPLVNSYAEDIEELERIKNRAQTLTGALSWFTPLDMSAIKDHAPDDIAPVLDAFIYGYCVNQQAFRSYKPADKA